MNLFVAFDMKVIEYAEKFCHWFQRLTGKTNYWISQQMSMLFFGLTGVLLSQGIADLFSSAYMMITCIFYFFSAPYEEKQAFGRLKNGVANPQKRRGAYIGLRMVSFFLVIFNDW